jgi:hypothetical protein
MKIYIVADDVKWEEENNNFNIQLHAFKTRKSAEMKVIELHTKQRGANFGDSLGEDFNTSHYIAELEVQE